MRTTLNVGMSPATRFGIGENLLKRADEVLRRWPAVDLKPPNEALADVRPEVKQGLLTPDNDLFDTVIGRLYRRQDEGSRAWHRALPDVMTRVRHALNEAVGGNEAFRRILMVQSLAQHQQ